VGGRATGTRRGGGGGVGGYTVPELMVAVLITAILLFLLMPGLFGYQAVGSVRSLGRQFVSDAREAQELALAANVPTCIWLHTVPGVGEGWQVFQGWQCPTANLAGATLLFTGGPFPASVGWTAHCFITTWLPNGTAQTAACSGAQFTILCMDTSPEAGNINTTNFSVQVTAGTGQVLPLPPGTGKCS